MTSEIPLQSLQSIRQRILSLCILKFALITVILGAAAFVYWLTHHSRVTVNLLHRIVIGLVVFEYLTLLVILALLHRNSPHAIRVFFLSIFIDILLTTLLVHLTGNTNSPYLVLYMVGIISAALVMPVPWAIFVTCAAMGMYLFVTIAGNAGLLDWLGNFGMERLKLSELASRLGVHGSAMAAVSVLSITLARHILRMEAEGLDRSRQIRILFNRHQDILRSLSDGVLCVSRDGRILDVNPAFCNMLNIDVHTGDAMERLPASVIEWIVQKPSFLHIEYDNNFNTLELEVSVQTFLVENRPEGFILVVRDRSHQARLERDLARKEKLAALGRLTASIAHEIRNPLTSIAGSLELLKPSMTQVSPENYELFDIVFREIKRLNMLLSELRQYTSERRRVVENLDLVEIIREIVRLCSQDPRYTTSRFQMEVPDTCLVRYDPDGLRQILLNLTINAIQAAPGKTITFRVVTTGDEIHVDIEDEGPGIDPEFQEKIFEPFVSTKQSGTGLGLAIAGQIALAHSGRLQLVHTGPSGTCMRLVIVQKSENK